MPHPVFATLPQDLCSPVWESYLEMGIKYKLIVIVVSMLALFAVQKIAQIMYVTNTRIRYSVQTVSVVFFSHAIP